MFRECFFEYAGQSSQPYNLMLCYVSNSNTDFDSGGGFDLKTDTLPRSHETLLYGKDYSAKPLEFDVEFMNLHGYIPLEQMIEIKNWLFGQDGWKTFRCLDDRQDYRLKCVFEPGEDIVDGTGYRGLRCKLRNVSPFWYGNPVTISFGNAELNSLYSNAVDARPYWFGYIHREETRKYAIFEIDIPENVVDVSYYPVITADMNQSAIDSDTTCAFHLSNTDVDTIADGSIVENGVFDYDSTSCIAINTEYINSNASSLTDRYDTITLFSQYGYVKSERYPSQDFNHYKPQLPYLNLHKGKNILRLLDPSLYTQLNISYSPVYRMGAF